MFALFSGLWAPFPVLPQPKPTFASPTLAALIFFTSPPAIHQLTFCPFAHFKEEEKARQMAAKSKRGGESAPTAAAEEEEVCAPHFWSVDWQWPPMGSFFLLFTALADSQWRRRE
jgi:hypothetical protein